MQESRRLYRADEAAEELGISRARLYRFLAAGEIASVKIGASRRIPASALDAFVARLCEEQGCDIAPAGIQDRNAELAAA